LKDECVSDPECYDPNSVCEYDPLFGVRKCKCKRFYVGDERGRNCVPGPGKEMRLFRNTSHNIIKRQNWAILIIFRCRLRH
jgi:hypothetical protein